MRNASATPIKPKRESNAAFLKKLERIARDWRYSDEFIGLVVRDRWPRSYDDLKAGR